MEKKSNVIESSPYHGHVSVFDDQCLDDFQFVSLADTHPSVKSNFIFASLIKIAYLE